ncbi:uridine 5'-monophosphate synthase isoform X1 [Schistocerca gregaria]|uniref:uridine 5'-monophosphate synthase isoform X1 n=2 Tax=Schistocerca gregaria TaxID=7010 RepID=UPI00211E55AB|nr:uridine 5'-monophosphate synthase isoform X1 [Schistocerca gregaria]
MSSVSEELKSLVVQLYEIDALKFGDYKMKVGINSPVYFDLRVIVSHPSLMSVLSKLLWNFAQNRAKCNHICGVPYTALPIASLISVNANIPMLIRRKETKSYGTRKLIEGKFKKGDTCIIIEDVVTSGSSILDTYRDLTQEGLVVTEAVVVVDREQGGTQNVAQYGIQMSSLCTLSQIMDILHEAGKVDLSVVDSVRKYISASQIPLINYINTTVAPADEQSNRLTMSFAQRASYAGNSVAAELFAVMTKKKSNLCLAADMPKTADLLTLTRAVAEHICLLKIHCDIIEDFSKSFVQELTTLAKEHNFLILEDRKFADIGHISTLQYSTGTHHIVSWADAVTAHVLPGDGILNGLKSQIGGRKRGCFVVVEMSSEGNLASQQYISDALDMCLKHEDFVCGIVCQSPRLLQSPGLVQLSPGVSLSQRKTTDGLGQQYTTPEDIVLVRGADVVVAGRAISASDDPVASAAEIRSRLWNAYEQRIKISGQTE